MAEHSFIFIVIFLVISFLTFFLFRRNNKNYKPSALKKNELIKQYEYEMLKLISKYEKDENTLKQKKIEFLKQASAQLHKNIFFDEYEVKALVQKLASL